MADMEKVIRDMEQFRADIKPFCGSHADWARFDAGLALLKEQEAVEPDTDSEGTCTCGNCGETVGYYPVGCKTPNRLCRFCHECGKAVKWE